VRFVKLGILKLNHSHILNFIIFIFHFSFAWKFHFAEIFCNWSDSIGWLKSFSSQRTSEKTDAVPLACGDQRQTNRLQCSASRTPSSDAHLNRIPFRVPCGLGNRLDRLASRRDVGWVYRAKLEDHIPDPNPTLLRRGTLHNRKNLAKKRLGRVIVGG